MDLVQRTCKPLWLKLTRKTFHCPQCSQKLRVPVRPGKDLHVSCARCHSTVLLSFKIPLIECFRWQSGKSLKQNLLDFHHRFWNLPLSQKIQAFLWLFIVAMLLDMVLAPLFQGPMMNPGVSAEDPLLSLDPIRKI